MSNVVVVGSQWGDEGKGKVVDWLSSRADVVVRFQGGHNAGHTLVIDGKVYKLSLLPSGIVREGKLSIIGNGVVIDPYALLEEIAKLQEAGVNINPDRLKVAENAVLILPVYKELDKAAEAARGHSKIGTTGRGIGPAYEDKVARRAVRVVDLGDPATLRQKIEQMMVHHNALLMAYGAPIIAPQAIYDELMQIAPQILQYAAPVWKILDKCKKDGERILFEGAQGVMLDVDHGTYPYVTSSNTVAAQAASGSGVAPSALNYVLGITKAYTTRVGSGPFPSELFDEIGRMIGAKGKEFGTVTGRTRRCGWFDAVMVKQAAMISGIDGIVLTKLDILDGIEKLRICVGYEYEGQKLDYFPPNLTMQRGIKPIYEEIDGWSESTFGARSWVELPANAIKYIRRIEELIEKPVAMVSTSPEREDVILVKDPFVG